MILETLFQKIPFAQILSKPTTNVSGVATDSNLVEPGDLFIPLIGEHQNGYRFLNKALEKGAAAIAGDEIRARRNHVACVYLPNAESCVPYLSANVYGNPSRMLDVVGVAGTNGKTTTAHIIEAMMRAIHQDHVGYIGTTAYRWARAHQESKFTTPPSPLLQRIFRKMVGAEVKSVVIECSSHGVVQGRLDFTQFNGVVFTNLTRDHLDYHQNFVSYRNAKWRLFSTLLVESEKKDKFAVFNIDDPTGRSWAREDLPRVRTVTYSTQSIVKADIHAESYELLRDSIRARIRTPNEVLEIQVPMIGIYNLENVLAAVSVAHAMNMDMKKVQNVLSQGVYVPGRLEKINGKGFEVFIDYAHTEDALSRTLDIMQFLKQKRVITVFGCGGNSDVSKRPLMGSIAVKKSDIVIVTSDNPRDENPEKIIDDIFEGVNLSQNPQKEVLRITKRDEAIKKALSIATLGDVLLIAGKGHETFQEVVGSRLPFDDRKVVKEWLKIK